MPKLEVVFRGTYDFCLDLPKTEATGIAGALARLESKGAWYLEDLEGLQGKNAPDFLYAQAVCIPKVEISLDDYYSNFVPILPSAARWVFCFPVIRRWGSRLYTPRTWIVPAYGDDVYYTLTSLASKTPIRAVRSSSDLNFFEFLFPRQRQPEDKLVVIRAKGSYVNKRGYFSYIRSQDIIEQEIISDSGIRIL